MADASLGEEISRLLEEDLLMHTHWNTIRRKGADTDSIVGSDNWWETMEVFFWLEEFGYDRWLGLDLLPKSEPTNRAVEISIMAMEMMYAEMMEIKDDLEQLMHDPEADATQTLELLYRARGTRYTPVK